ncbi:putative ligninase lg6 precursor [Phaeomoniella chlamydospora]|uniref:Peroxidase n=1 Tax=Phaeomoniella chlamydospora TaxID=158046 RepID=A0A0G2H9V4_PHACM|nr:putative ligninase lg6 precursor [Phaeomoniella chlamydospora]
MHLKTTPVVSFSLINLLVALSSAESVSSRDTSSCPSVWTTIATDLKSTFVADNGTCTSDARAAIRLSFHDCFPEACDGSIILADECSSRVENTQLVDICTTIGDKATQYNVSTADMIQFGAAMGIASCPGGPAISFYAGRTDTSIANPESQIPNRTSNASVLISQFAAKGFTAAELVALVGAHTTARQLSGTALDSTPGTWDADFYSQTSSNSAPSSLDSDRFLSNSSETSDTWTSTGASASAFSDAFVPALLKRHKQ